jgi:thiosulfate dehydrogenase
MVYFAKNYLIDSLHDMDRKPFDIPQIIKLVNSLLAVILLMLVLVGLMAGSLLIGPTRIQTYFAAKNKIPIPSLSPTVSNVWKAPDTSTISTDASGDEIKYGRELVAHTSEYLGPKGKVMMISNGMNCQNCHLDAGTKPFGNNYSAVASTYPKFRARSGAEETIEKRVNDCFERSLNGKPLADDSREMKAIVAYIKWVGAGVTKGESPKGSGLVEISFLDEPASVVKGKVLYEEKCTVCHGKSGNGILNADGIAWTYPPLWGKDSYNDGAGLYRLSRFAGYIKANMPLGATYDQPLLTDEEAWNLAAYVNSLARPKKDITHDWPDISKKPVDHPFGPFADDFDEQQHKYGPFKPIQVKRKELSKLK